MATNYTFGANENLDKLLEQLLQDGPTVRNIDSGLPSAQKERTSNGELASDFGAGGLYNPKLYTDAFKKVFGGGRNRAAKNAAKQAVGESNVRARQEYVQQIKALKQEMAKRALRTRINEQFGSQEMEGLYDSLKNRALEGSLADIVDKYQGQVRGAGFQTARQGLQGSSVDAERRGGISQAQNAEAVQAAGNAQGFVNNLRGQNEAARQQLVNTVTSGNPAQGAQVGQQIQGIQNQTRQLGQDYANQAAQRQLSQYGLNMQSQALGNLLTTYGNLYQTGQQAQGYGNSGSAF